ncbi:MAG TPA: hypothetical protein VIL30_02190, partial [Ramlibacter sp.]
MKMLATLLLLVAPAWLAAQPADPLKSAACGQALAALDAARGADPRGAQVPALRNQAAQVCLGGGEAPGRSARVLQPPSVVPPPTIAPPPQPEPLALPRLPTPPVAIDRPATLSHCDAGGCWAN